MSPRKVAITGVGVVTPLADNAPDFFKALLEGRNGISPIERFDPSPFPTRIAGEIKDFDPLKRLEAKEIRRLDLYAVYALYATAEAVEDSGFLKTSFDPDRTGVYIASGIGGIDTLYRETLVFLEKGPRRVSPFLVPMMIPDIAGGLVSIKYGLKGPNFCIVSACASGTHAIGEAARLIRDGYADIMIAGGAEAPITPMALAGFCSMKALSTRNEEPEKASRPFDRDRDGFVMGEGAGVVVLEALDHALERGAKIYGLLEGYAATSDAYHITAPCADGEGAYKVMKYAIEDAGITPDEVDYINAHGTSTKLNDVAETLAIKRAFGERAYQIPISSTKSMIGHLLGAAGGVEAVATILSVYHGKIHPTRNLENPDPECDLDYVPEGARELRIRHALSTSYGFGGHNAAIVVGAYTE